MTWKLSRWFWGVIPLLIAAAIVTVTRRAQVEDDLLSRTTAALQQDGQTWAKIGFDGRDGQLRGVAPTPEDADRAAALITGTRGVRVLDTSVTLPDIARPFVWELSRDGLDEPIVLSGTVPNDTLRQRNLQAVRGALGDAGADAEIEQRTRVARGVPAELAWEAATTFAATQFARLAEGTITLTDTAFNIVGQARDRETFDALTAAVSADELPGGLTRGEVVLTPPTQTPYTLSATLAGAGEQRTLQLSGYAVSVQDKERIVSVVRESFPGVTIQDDLALGAGEPDGWAQTTATALVALSKLDTGTLEITDRSVTLSGTAERELEIEDIQTGFVSGLPAGVEAQADLNFLIAALPLADPFVFKVQADGDTVSLTGFVPDLGTQQQLLAAARAAYPGSEVTTGLQIARGAPEGFGAAATRVLNVLAQGARNGGTNTVELRGTGVEISGDVDSQNARAGLRAQLDDALDGSGFALQRFMMRVVPPTVSPYVWSLSRDENRLKLKGYAPDTEARSTIESMVSANFPGLTLNNTLEMASGAGDRDAWFGGVGYAMRLMGRLTTGAVEIIDGALKVRGRARDTESYETLLRLQETAAAQLPDGIKLSSLSVLPPRFSPFQLQGELTDGVLSLTGQVTSEAERQALLAAIAEQAPDVQVNDFLVIGDGAPRGWTTAAREGLAGLSQLGAGTVTVRDEAFSLTATVANDQPDAFVTDLRPRLPASYRNGQITVTSSLPVADPFTFGIERTGARVTLSGVMPNDATRDALLEQLRAQFPNANVVDETTRALGAPDDLEAVAGAMIGALGKAEDGGLTYSGGSISGALSAAREADANSALTALREQLPTGASSADVSTRFEIAELPVVSPYAVGLTWDGSVFRATGTVPDDATRNAILAAASAQFGGSTVVDELGLGRGAPVNYGAALEAGLAALGKLTSGSFSLSDQTASFSGTLPDGQTADDVDGAMAALTGALPDGFGLAQVDLTVPPAEAETETEAATGAETAGTGDERETAATDDSADTSAAQGTAEPASDTADAAATVSDDQTAPASDTASTNGGAGDGANEADGA
ncbi:MAG: hypothetical protein AAFO79_04215, partial [Pseudomonadota bacterium]